LESGSPIPCQEYIPFEECCQPPIRISDEAHNWRGNNIEFQDYRSIDPEKFSRQTGEGKQIPESTDGIARQTPEA
jgi:hypothetical protein